MRIGGSILVPPIEISTKMRNNLNVQKNRSLYKIRHGQA